MTANHLIIYIPSLMDFEKLKINRSQFIDELKNLGVGSSVHFIPLYKHPFYKNNFHLRDEDFPVSERIYPNLISLPIWPGMTLEQIEKVIFSVEETISKFYK